MRGKIEAGPLASPGGSAEDRVAAPSPAEAAYREGTSIVKVAHVTLLTVAGLFSASSANALKLTSLDIKPGGRIADEQAFNGADCTGKNVSPALVWSGAPKGTKSFAVSIFDPDAPTGSGFWHWWVADLPADATGLAKGAGSGTGLPAGAVQARNDFGTIGYGGPCPPEGKPHHYQITVYALDIDKLGVDKDASPAVVASRTHAHALAKATLTGLYGR
jgi:Raf kinase inhibitor-like YbhB/YbcL family protein